MVACGNKECNQEGISKCGKCRQILYCSRACQAIDWKQGGHKTTCFASAEQRSVSTEKQLSKEKSSSQAVADLVGRPCVETMVVLQKTGRCAGCRQEQMKLVQCQGCSRNGTGETVYYCAACTANNPNCTECKGRSALCLAKCANVKQPCMYYAPPTKQQKKSNNQEDTTCPNNYCCADFCAAKWLEKCYTCGVSACRPCSERRWGLKGECHYLCPTCGDKHCLVCGHSALSMFQRDMEMLKGVPNGNPMKTQYSQLLQDQQADILRYQKTHGIVPFVPSSSSTQQKKKGKK